MLFGAREVHLAVLESYIRWLPYSLATIDRSTVCDGFQLQVDQLLLPLLSQFMDYIALVTVSEPIHKYYVPWNSGDSVKSIVDTTVCFSIRISSVYVHLLMHAHNVPMSTTLHTIV